MPRPDNQVARSAASSHQWFTTTHWCVVRESGGNNSSLATEALEKLCQTYWSPIYASVRRQGLGPEEAQDLTQGFFATLLRKNFWNRADPRKGRFRNLLLTALRQYLADERDRAHAGKRGGGTPLISLDEYSGEESFVEPPGRNLTVEQQFDRQWAAAVLEQARARLHQECVASGKSGLYDRVNLLGDNPEASLAYVEVARQLGMSVSAVKTAIFRLRERYGQIVREEVAQTVTHPSEVDGEIRYLLSVVGS